MTVMSTLTPMMHVALPSQVLGADPYKRGHQPNLNYGAEGDFYVDGSVGASGDGSFATPFKTVQEGVDAANAAGGGVVSVRAGTYREYVTMRSNVTLRRYRREEVWITGQNLASELAGASWTQVTSGTGTDADRLGSTLAASGNVWKLNIAKAAILEPTTLNVYEDGVYVGLAQIDTGTSRHPGGFDRLFALFPGQYPLGTFLQADDSPADTSGDPIAKVRDSRLEGLPTAAVVGQAELIINHNGGDVTGVLPIGAYDAGTGTVTLVTPVSRGTINQEGFQILNCPALLLPGNCASVDEGDETVTIYLYPHADSPTQGGLDAGVTVAVRDRIIYGNNVKNCRVEGLRLQGVAGKKLNPDPTLEGKLGGKSIYFQSSENIAVADCLCGQCDNLTSSAYGTVLFRHCVGVQVERLTVHTSGGMQGYQIMGVEHVRLRQCEAYRLGEAWLKCYGVTDAIFAFCDAWNIAKGSHSNAWNFYQACRRILLYGNRVLHTFGYGTWQDIADLFIGMHIQEASSSTGIASSGRCLIDQNGDFGAGLRSPGDGVTAWFWNFQTLPYDAAPWLDTSGLQIGDLRPDSTSITDQEDWRNTRYAILNGILHGGGAGVEYVAVPANEQRWGDYFGWTQTEGPLEVSYCERRRGSILYTGDAFWQSAQYNGWALVNGEVMQKDLALVYTDVAGSDYTAPSGSPILTYDTPQDLAETIGEAQAIFPDFDDFDRDADGNLIADLSATKLGALQRDYNAQMAAMLARMTEVAAA